MGPPTTTSRRCSCAALRAWPDCALSLSSTCVCVSKRHPHPLSACHAHTYYTRHSCNSLPTVAPCAKPLRAAARPLCLPKHPQDVPPVRLLWGARLAACRNKDSGVRGCHPGRVQHRCCYRHPRSSHYDMQGRGIKLRPRSTALELHLRLRTRPPGRGPCGLALPALEARLTAHAWRNVS